MSSSRHPIALSLERRVSGSTRLLAVVMLLPLVDGIFAALVLSGALSDLTGILEVGLLVFGGSATVAVVLADMHGSPRDRARAVLGVGAVLVGGAVLVAVLAPTVASLLTLWVFERFAAVVILAVAARTASARIAELLPRPAAVVALGVIASIDPSGATLAVQIRPGLAARAGAAAGVGVAVALVVALASRRLTGVVDIDRFRFGSAVALGVLALSVFGAFPTDAPLALVVLAVTVLLALDPAGTDGGIERYRPDNVDITAALAGTGPDEEAAEPGPDREGNV